MMNSMKRGNFTTRKEAGDTSSTPWLGRSPEEGNGNPLQNSRLAVSPSNTLDQVGLDPGNSKWVSG